MYLNISFHWLDCLLSVRPSVFMSVCMSVCLPACISVCLPFCSEYTILNPIRSYRHLEIYLLVDTSTYFLPSRCLYVCLPFCLVSRVHNSCSYFYLPVCLSVCLSLRCTIPALICASLTRTSYLCEVGTLWSKYRDLWPLPTLHTFNR